MYGSRATLVFESLSLYSAAIDPDQTPFSCVALLLMVSLFPSASGACGATRMLSSTLIDCCGAAARRGSDALWRLFASPQGKRNLRAAAR